MLLDHSAEWRSADELSAEAAQPAPLEAAGAGI